MELNAVIQQNTPSPCLALGAPGHRGCCGSYFGDASALVMWFQLTDQGWVGWWPWVDPACSAQCGSTLQMNDTIGRKSYELIVFSNNLCISLWGWFQPIFSFANELGPSLVTQLHWEDMALEQPAPVAWNRNLHAAWWMLLLLTQISGWMSH